LVERMLVWCGTTRETSGQSALLGCSAVFAIVGPAGVSGVCSRSAPAGLAKGEFDVSEALFEPLPDNILDAFEGAR